MKLSVGFNWDRELLDYLSDIPEVADLHVLLPKTVVGAGSLAYLAPDVDRGTVEDFVKDAHRAGKTFTVVLDAPNMEATEWEPEVHEQVLELFGWLEAIKVDRVELAIPYLVELVHVRFPKLAISVSPTTRAATMDTVNFLIEMGAESVGIEPLAQRRFDVLKTLATESEVPIWVNATEGMLRGSPSYGNFDYVWTNAVHSSPRGTDDAYGEFAKTYNPAFDDGYKVSHPVELVRANFIRPEDVKTYEDAGIQWFKLDCAIYPTVRIKSIVDAYVARSFKGNLVDLVNLFYAGHSYQKEATQGPLERKQMSTPPEAIANFFKLLDDRGFVKRMVQVENSLLEGYLQHVVLGECRAIDCPTCAEYATKAVRLDPELSRQFVETLDAYRATLATGEYLA
jgi:hypothetical protein